MSKIVLGIDPGSHNTGYGIIQSNPKGPRVLSFGVIETDSEKRLERRLLKIGTSLKEIIKQYQPHCFVVEKTFFAKNADSAAKLGHARGVAVYEGVASGLDFFEYNPTEVKLGLTGSGRADKEQVQSCVRAFLGLPRIDQLDASDALALALHHILVSSTLDKMREGEILN